MVLPSFGTDGVRGVANTDLTPEVALALGRAAAGVLGGDTFVIGRDPRRSGPMLEAALAAGLAASGASVELLGVVPTPTVAWVCAERQLPGAMISASHNPFADNGIKLFAAGGIKLSDAAEADIQARFHAILTDGANTTAAPTGAGVGEITSHDPCDDWVHSVVESLGGRKLDGARVVLDGANGAASIVGPMVFEELGAHVTVIGNEPDGLNINLERGSTSPAALQAAVVEHSADMGLAFDGDADRLIAVDHTGAIVDGDHILAILANDWAASGRLRHNTLVVTVMSNLGLHLAMREAGIEVRQTGVGDRYVLAELDAGNFSLGGEQSGHVICRDLATTGDGVLAAAQLADAVVRSGSSLAELASNAMSTVPQVLKNVRLPARDPELLAKLSPHIEAAEAELGTQGRVLVRASGTEPLIRVMVEHLDAATAERICAQLVQTTQSFVTGG
ncbi:MAG: phosphoglucosamine mutase [Acidimicrobiales bacterium]